MKRVSIPQDLAARVMFESDRTCCVCRSKGKPVQLHHIDGNNRNSVYSNLAVLCLDCHTDTQIKGGFHRKLDAEQVALYRSDWVELVTRERVTTLKRITKQNDNGVDIELVTSVAEILRERKQYEMLAIHYENYGNTELRDKYIALALKEPHDPSAEIYLRCLQSRQDLLSAETIEARIAEMKENEDWSQLGRLYVDLGRVEEAVECYCRVIVDALHEGRSFPAAFYLKELCREKLFVPLFERAYRKSSEENDLWWQTRALQELGWDSELKDLLVQHKEEIEKSGDTFQKIELYAQTGERDKYREAYKELNRNIYRGKVTGKDQENEEESGDK